MDTAYIIRQLDFNKSAFEPLMKIKSPEEAIWRPNTDHWCLLEIVCHLVDEEVKDFRKRIQTALDPEGVFVPIDPVGWVSAHHYMAQDYEAKASEWLAEREKSLYWLQSLSNVDWNSTLHHPEMGNLSAYHFLANWMAHDYIHLRQIMKVKHAWLAHISGQELSYAGNW